MSRILGSELIPKTIDKINSKEMIVVVATVDGKGIPNTAPIHLIHAKDGRRLRLAIHKNHETMKNIQGNGNICVSIMGKDNTAISIKGVARLIEDSITDPGFSIVEVKITSIKSDRAMHAEIVRGARVKLNKNSEELIYKLFDELR